MHSSSVFCEETICSNRTCIALISTRNPTFNINISFHVLFFWKLLLKCLIAKNVAVYSCLSCATLFCFVARAQTFVQQRDIREIISGQFILSMDLLYFCGSKIVFFCSYLHHKFSWLSRNWDAGESCRASHRTGFVSISPESSHSWVFWKKQVNNY